MNLERHTPPRISVVAKNATTEIELPHFLATWWPLSMETVLGSGEAINVAVVVRAASGPCKIRQSVSPDVLMTLFGTAGEGEGVAYMVGATVIALQKQMDEGVTIESLGMPFDGFALCECRDCAVRDMSELFSIGVKLSTAFGVGAA